jgi:hypothetical protein
MFHSVSARFLLVCLKISVLYHLQGCILSHYAELGLEECWMECDWDETWGWNT